MDDKLRKSLFAQIRRLEREKEILKLKIQILSGEIPQLQDSCNNQ